jgi:capsular exopolysaccharide synthesis family protein
VKEKLNLYQVDNTIINEAIDRIVVKLHGINKKEGSKTFLCTGVGANVGTTSTAFSIAISLAEAGYKTLFIDCDLRKDPQYKRIDNVKSGTLTGYLSGETDRYNDVIHSTNVDNLSYVAAGNKNENPVRLLCNERIAEYLDGIKRDYDYIIIDTPSIGIANDAEVLIPYVDKYLLVVGMNESTKKQLVDARIQLSEYEDKFIGIIANKMQMYQYKGEIRDFDYFTGNKLIKKKINGLNSRKETDQK